MDKLFILAADTIVSQVSCSSFFKRKKFGNFKSNNIIHLSIPISQICLSQLPHNLKKLYGIKIFFNLNLKLSLNSPILPGKNTWHIFILCFM